MTVATLTYTPNLQPRSQPNQLDPDDKETLVMQDSRHPKIPRSNLEPLPDS